MDVKGDKRFATIAKDPRFHQMKRKDRKVTIDKRFHGMFNDKKFKVKYSVDKRGRPIRTTTDDHLKKYYDLSGTDQDDAPEDEEEGQEEAGKKQDGETPADEGNTDKISDESEDESSEEEDESAEEEPGTSTGEAGKGPDLARGDGNVESSSESSDEEEEEELFKDKVAKFDHKWGEVDESVTQVEEITDRLAICNLDWDRIKASDLFVLFNSFKPTGGIIKSIKIYPSEFGKERMAEEDRKGPKELVEHDDDEDENDENYQREKLRQYQMNRLRYYYAVMDCDSPETANKIYSECDGLEYESSATKIDLRFIPMDMTFDDPPTSEATSAPDISTFKPKFFTTKALQQTKPDLTWDETDRDRIAVTMKNFTKEELENLDMKDYLASSESELDEDPYGDFIEQPDFALPKSVKKKSKSLEAFKEAVKSSEKKIEKKKKKKDDDDGLKITWDPDLKASDMGKNKKASPWEQFLEKKKDKKKKNKKTEVKVMQQDKAKKRMTKKEESEDEEIVEDNEEMVMGEAAFSDDELPDDMDIEALTSQSAPEKKTNNMKKKKKGRKNDSQENEDKDGLSLLLMDEEDDRQHFSLKKIMEKEGTNISKTKRKKLKKLKKKTGETTVEDTFKIDVADSRFSDVFNNPHYNIDPSAPEYKATKATEALIAEKIKRRQDGTIKPITKKRSNTEPSTDSPAKISRVDQSNTTKDTALASLVKSVKAKTQTLNAKKKR